MSTHLVLLWQEYRAKVPNGFGYSWFCEHHGAWAERLWPAMRQAHVAGEKLFSDYAGRTVEVIDGATGKVRQAQVFTAAISCVLVRPGGGKSHLAAAPGLALIHR
jgi:transposase